VGSGVPITGAGMPITPVLAALSSQDEIKHKLNKTKYLGELFINLDFRLKGT